MLTILTFLVAYLMIGTVIGRRDYARRNALANTTDVTLEQKRTELANINHGINCWLGPNYRYRDRDCDCNKRGHWQQVQDQIATLEAGGVVRESVDGPYRMVFGWPLLGYHSFLTSGRYTLPPSEALRSREWEKRVEKELGMKPLELDS